MSYQTINPTVHAYVPYGGSYHYNDIHHAYIIRDVRGAIMGTFSLENGTYRDGLPSWLDPQNAATVSAQPEPEPVIATIDEMLDEVLGPEPVVAVIDSPQDEPTADNILDEIFGAEATISGEGETTYELASDVIGPSIEEVQHAFAGTEPSMSYEEPEPSYGDIMFDLMKVAASEGKLTSFQFSTSTGVTGAWRK